MKRRLVASAAAMFLILAVTLLSCTTGGGQPRTTVQVAWDAGASYAPQVEFAAGDIVSAVKDTGSKVVDNGAEWMISFDGIDEALGEQAYKITVSQPGGISIVGGDANGLMYGGLEVADQIKIGGGVNAVTGKAVVPYVLQRGFKYNIPWDMRTPTYTSPGDSGQKNIGNVWDREFWQEFLDAMARNRFNNIEMRSLSPFPSLVKVEGYEDIALDDIWRTTIPFDNSYAGNLVNAVREEHWENYEILKKMTIEEKIKFYNEVFAYAKDRGVNMDITVRHIYSFGEQGKYGITNDMDNEITKDYFYKSAKALINTYPDLRGLGITDGENFGWDNSPEAHIERMQWLHDVYVPAVNEALEDEPDRDFRLVVYVNATEEVVELFSDCTADVEFGGVYTGTHMYASSTPKISEHAVSILPEGEKLWLAFRNEDVFNMRWGDPDFVREFVQNMPVEAMAGYHTGSDGYFYGRDYSSTDPELQGQLYLKKHWFNYMLIGRLSFEPDMTDERIYALFNDHLGNMEKTDILFEATSEAGKIVPQVHKIYYRGNSDYTWFVEGSWSHPNTFGYLDIKSWMKSTNIFPEGDCISITDYALKLAAGEAVNERFQTPIEVSDALKGYAGNVLAKVDEIRNEVNKNEELSLTEKNYWSLVSDNEAMSYLGLYYSEKILGAVDLRVYNETEDEAYKGSSVAHLEKALEYWKKYAAVISANYVPQQMARVGSFDVNEITKGVEKDAKTAGRWRPRVIPVPQNIPSKTDYFKDSLNEVNN